MARSLEEAVGLRKRVAWCPSPILDGNYDSAEEVAADVGRGSPQDRCAT